MEPERVIARFYLTQTFARAEGEYSFNMAKPPMAKEEIPDLLLKVKMQSIMWANQ